MQMESTSTSAGRRSPTVEEIRARAYEIYLSRGDRPGNPQSDWEQAERELRAQIKAAQSDGLAAGRGMAGGSVKAIAREDGRLQPESKQSRAAVSAAEPQIVVKSTPASGPAKAGAPRASDGRGKGKTTR
jgi:hypothetical protein